MSAIENLSLTQLGAGILSLLASALLGFYIRHRAQRPRLTIEGHGCSSHGVQGHRLSITEVFVYNNPSFFGLKLNREPARIVHAAILDPLLEKFVGPALVWQKGDPSEGLKELEPEHTIGSGLMGRLFLFAKYPSDESFFVYRATALDAVPENSSPKFRDLRRVFVLNLVDVNQRGWRFRLDASHDDGSVTLIYKKTWRDRWQTLLEVFK